jgi:adenylylsulfate kinase
MKHQVIWHNATVTRARREALNGHRGVIVWFTGLSGAGKSTIAHTVEERLHQAKCRTFVFDGDNVRHGLCSDLGFSAPDRSENIRRIGEMTKLFIEAGIIVLTAFISPFRADRKRVRSLVAPGDFLEVYCRCPLVVCEERDVKGFYKKARGGEIPEFTGISSPYEEPNAAELILNTGSKSVEECASEILALLQDKKVIGEDIRLDR